MMTQMKTLSALFAILLVASVGQAEILSVIEVGLDGDAGAIVETTFGEDALTYSDRTHEHNGAAFDEAGLLSTSGTNIIGLPSYLVGSEYLRFANDARDNAGYSATVIADEKTRWYLLVDNRLDGPAGNKDGSNTTDPVLGGTLQWVIDGNWERVDTGISPNGQADYTGIDESGNGTGAGQGLNQFYSVYKFPLDINVVTVFSNGIGGSNMISLVASPIPEPSTILLLSLGLVGLALAYRKRK